MEIIRKYTFNHLKRNKKQAIFTCTAIMIAAVFISCFLTFLYSFNQSRIDFMKKIGGNWHAEFFTSINGKDVPYVQNHAEVEETLFKTDWETKALENSNGRPYLVHIDLSKAYANEMGWEDMVVEGRLPQKDNEIILSEDFFKDHPEYKLGDTITTFNGYREVNGERIKALDNFQTGETFQKADESTQYKIVGILDASQEYAGMPVYMSMGFSDEVVAEKDYVVYVRLKNPKNVYDFMPQMSQQLGITADEEGNFPIKYNTEILESLGVFKNELSRQFVNQCIMYTIIGLIIMAFFVIIIYQAFAVSANSRIRQLGLLKSIGATPKQIRDSVLFEGTFLSILVMPIGILVGTATSGVLLEQFRKIYEKQEIELIAKVYFSPWVIVAAVVGTLMVVLISAYLPARKVAKLAPILAIKQSGRKIDRIKTGFMSKLVNKLFGYEGELALKSNVANKKASRAAVISLTLSFVIFVGTWMFLNIWEFTYFQGGSDYDYSVRISLSDADREKVKLLNKQVETLDGVELMQESMGTLYFNSTLSTDELSNEIRERGTKHFEKYYKDNKMENGYQVTIDLLSVDDRTFNNYCKVIGVDANQFYNTKVPKGILYNATVYDNSAAWNMQEEIPFLDKQAGDKLHLTEILGRDYGKEEAYQFDMEIGAVTEQKVELIYMKNFYRPMVVMPETGVKELINKLSEGNQERFNRVVTYLRVPENEIKNVCSQIEEIYKGYNNKANFNVWDILSQEEGINDIINMMVQLTFIIIVFIAFIGVVNVYSTMSNAIFMRRKEFAVLKSVGLTPEGVRKMLFLENLFYSIRPILIGTPLLLAIGVLFLNMAGAPLGSIFTVFPYGFYLIGAVVMSILIFGISYGVSSKIKKENIIDVVKDEMQ